MGRPDVSWTCSCTGRKYSYVNNNNKKNPTGTLLFSGYEPPHENTVFDREYVISDREDVYLDGRVRVAISTEHDRYNARLYCVSAEHGLLTMIHYAMPGTWNPAQFPELAEYIARGSIQGLEILEFRMKSPGAETKSAVPESVRAPEHENSGNNYGDTDSPADGQMFQENPGTAMLRKNPHALTRAVKTAIKEKAGEFSLRLTFKGASATVCYEKYNFPLVTKVAGISDVPTLGEALANLYASVNAIRPGDEAYRQAQVFYMSRQELIKCFTDKNTNPVSSIFNEFRLAILRLSEYVQAMAIDYGNPCVTAKELSSEDESIMRGAIDASDFTMAAYYAGLSDGIRSVLENMRGVIPDNILDDEFPFHVRHTNGRGNREILAVPGYDSGDDSLQLHRFFDADGEPFSAIVIEGNEILSCRRCMENDMLRFFETMWVDYSGPEKLPSVTVSCKGTGRTRTERGGRKTESGRNADDFCLDVYDLTEESLTDLDHGGRG